MAVLSHIHNNLNHIIAKKIAKSINSVPQVDSLHLTLKILHVPEY